MVSEIVCAFISMTLRISILIIILSIKISCRNIFVWKVCAKPLRVIFDKVDLISRDYDGAKFLVPFGPEKNGVIFDRIRYIIG